VAKKRKSQHRRRSTASKPQPPVEDRRGEALTVAWTLTMMATLGAEVVGAAARGVMALSASPPTRLLAFPGLMLLTATVTGSLCLIMTPFVYRLRRVPPPTVVTTLAVTVSVLPIAIAVMMAVH